jgi:uncharacterized protein YndB with AHSA1/START domain
VIITKELHIDCPPTTAFDLMADVRETTSWHGGISQAEMTSDEPIGQASQLVSVMRGQTLDSTITTCDRPERLEFVTTGKLMDIAATFDFTGTEEGTMLVTMAFDARGKGLMSALVPLLGPIVKRDFAKQHANFKKLCETQAR